MQTVEYSTYNNAYKNSAGPEPEDLSIKSLVF